MNIINYTDYFHDGSIIDIQHVGDCVEISMESAEIEKGEMKEGIPLSKHNTIKGKLRLKGVKNIRENDKPVEKAKRNYDSAWILDLEVKEKEVELLVDWVNFPPKQDINEFSHLVIEAEAVSWENIPDLYDPLIE
ncbi:MAG: hypothetical protein ACFFDT_26255 [Candidatus Hodarchaeota archaeon]